MRYEEIVFLQGENYPEFERVLYPSTRTDPLLLLGPPQVDQALDYLTRWDNGEPVRTYDVPPWGSGDDIHQRGDYVLSYNTRLGYAGLVRIVRDT